MDNVDRRKTLDEIHEILERFRQIALAGRDAYPVDSPEWKRRDYYIKKNGYEKPATDGDIYAGVRLMAANKVSEKIG